MRMGWGLAKLEHSCGAGRGQHGTSLKARERDEVPKGMLEITWLCLSIHVQAIVVTPPLTNYPLVSA